MIDKFGKLRLIIEKEVSIIKEIILLREQSSKEKDFIIKQIESLKGFFEKINEELLHSLEEISEDAGGIFSDFPENIPFEGEKIELAPLGKNGKRKSHRWGSLEKETIKRLRKIKKENKKKKIIKPKPYVKASNQMFFNYAQRLSKNKFFDKVKTSLEKTNMQYTTEGYLSVIFFNTFLSAIFGVLLYILLLFLKINSSDMSISFSTNGILMKSIELFPIIFLLPIVVFFISYFYPSSEADSEREKINQELPFVIGDLNSVAESLVNPANMFRIIINTKEYPSTKKEFIKLINEIDGYGLDLISALKIIAKKSPSKELAEILNGLATTISTGGNLTEFLRGKSKKLILEYKLRRKRFTKFAGSFMEIYISLILAAPMILMLLLIMMRISNFGLKFSVSSITIMVVSVVSVMNIFSVIFLNVKTSRL